MLARHLLRFWCRNRLLSSIRIEVKKHIGLYDKNLQRLSRGKISFLGTGGRSSADATRPDTDRPNTNLFSESVCTSFITLNTAMEKNINQTQQSFCITSSFNSNSIFFYFSLIGAGSSFWYYYRLWTSF